MSDSFSSSSRLLLLLSSSSQSRGGGGSSQREKSSLVLVSKSRLAPLPPSLSSLSLSLSLFCSFIAREERPHRSVSAFYERNTRASDTIYTHTEREVELLLFCLLHQPR